MQMGFQLLCCLTSWHISNHVRHNGDAMNCLRRATKPDGGEADKNQKSCKQPPPVLDNLISKRRQLRLDIPLVWPKCLTPCCNFKNFLQGIEYCEIITSTQSLHLHPES